MGDSFLPYTNSCSLIYTRRQSEIHIRQLHVVAFYLSLEIGKPCNNRLLQTPVQPYFYSRLCKAAIGSFGVVGLLSSLLVVGIWST